MNERADPAVADPDAQAAPPRANGELVFEEPWESRAFGLAVALHDAGVVDFEDFRARLIAEIGAWEAEHGSLGAGHPRLGRPTRAPCEPSLGEGLDSEPSAAALDLRAVGHRTGVIDPTAQVIERDSAGKRTRRWAIPVARAQVIPGE